MLKALYANPDYLVSDQGFIVSKKSNKKLKTHSNSKGYQFVRIPVNGEIKGIAIHIAVMKTFQPNKDESKTQVNHIDGNKKNNSLKNLEWTTRQENIDHANYVLNNYKRGGDNKSARKVTATSKKDPTDIIKFDSIADAARYFNKNKDLDETQMVKSIIRAAKKERKTYKGYIWDYND